MLEANRRLAADVNRRDPEATAAAQRRLRENGFADVDEFMERLTGQYEAFKWMKE